MSTAPANRTPTWRRPATLIAAAAVLLVLVAGGAFLFQPWKAFVDTRVEDAAPAVATGSAAVAATGPSGASAKPSEPTAVVLSTGSFVSQEHATSGQVSVISLPDGRRILRIEGLDTSDGPDVHVWLTDAPVTPGIDGAGGFDQGAYVSLGKLKGNQGNQNYEIPATANLDALTSVSLWCDRFDVSFGAATLQAPA
jgi:hypothetical protein